MAPFDVDLEHDTMMEMDEMDERHAYGIDSYEYGKWIQTGVRGLNATREEAIAAGRSYSGASATHVHVWWNGECIYDSQEGASEPRNHR
jgi:hypothetical protein